MTLSLWIVFIILIFDAVEYVTLENTIHKENEIKNWNIEHEFIKILDTLKWSSYFWFTIGLTTGVVIMLIVNSKIYCEMWCPRILRRIRTFFRMLWRRFITWFHRFCLRRPHNEHSFPPLNIEGIRRRQRINTYTIPEFPCSPLQHLQRTQLPSLLQLSQLPRVSQLSCASRLPQFTNQPVFPSQESQLLAVSRQPHNPQQSPSSVSVSEQSSDKLQPTNQPQSPSQQSQLTNQSQSPLKQSQLPLFTVSLQPHIPQQSSPSSVSVLEQLQEDNPATTTISLPAVLEHTMTTTSITSSALLVPSQQFLNCAIIETLSSPEDFINPLFK